MKENSCRMTVALMRYDAARKAIAAAHRIDEVKQIRNKAEAVRVYAKQAGDFELQNQAAEIRLFAERRAGQLLSDMANPNRDPKESYKRRTLIPLASQQNLERPRLVAHQADGCEEPPKLNDWPEHPVLPPNGNHGAFVFATVGEESCCAFERLPAD